MNVIIDAVLYSYTYYTPDAAPQQTNHFHQKSSYLTYLVFHISIPVCPLFIFQKNMFRSESNLTGCEPSRHNAKADNDKKMNNNFLSQVLASRTHRKSVLCFYRLFTLRDFCFVSVDFDNLRVDFIGRGHSLLCFAYLQAVPFRISDKHLLLLLAHYVRR